MKKHWLSASVALMAVLAVLCCFIVGETGPMLINISEATYSAENVTDMAEPSNTAHPTETPEEEAQPENAAATDLSPEADQDEDGVEDYVEALFGTAAQSDDTDGDGLSDYTEIYQLATDPLAVDGDANGIADGDEDSDGDALSNSQELEMATDPSKQDTDSDGIADGDELAQSGTDPLSYDTDTDGVHDGYEKQLGTDPLTPQDRFEVSKNYHGERLSATVLATLDGEQVDSLSITSTATEELFPQTMPGYMGEACDVTVDGDWSDATVSFAFEGTGVVQPTIYYFSEDSQTLEAVETTVEGQVATATAAVPGTYVLLDRTVYEASFIWEDRWGVSELYAGVEVVLVMDDSGSMKRSDPENERLAVASDLIDRLPEGSRLGVVRVSTESTALTEALTDDRRAAKAFLADPYFVSDGETAMYTGIQKAITLLEDCRMLAQKVVIVLSDGFPTDYALYEDTVALAMQNDITFHCVTLGTERMNTVCSLDAFASEIGARRYTPESAKDLSVVYDDISRLVDLTTDTDGDTIPDYYEDHMVAFNGVTIPMDKTRADTDYDGVPDNKEVSVQLVPSEDGTHVVVKGRLLSDPSMNDSDGDGDPDGSDALPYDNSFSGTMVSEYVTSQVTFEMDYTWFLGDNTVYNSDLSKASALFSAIPYAETSVTLSDALGTKTVSTSSLAEVLSFFGMENARSYSLSEDYTDNHLSEVALGYRTISSGEDVRTVLAMVIRGTNKTVEEWSSNCDIGDLAQDTAEDDWINTDNHKGFDIAANRIMAYTERYIEECGLHKDTLVYWVTGHSRGAGIANIIGASLESQETTAFTYTFASPTTTLSSDAASYTTVFNIINADDFVPCLPITDWGYTRYGVSTSGISVRDSYEKEWESFTGISDYNSDGNNMEACVTALGGILTSGMDPRLDCYRYTCACHGDGTNDTITIKNTGMSESSRENAIAKIPANALPHCTITRYDGGWIGGWDFEVCQTPGYFMQLLAAFMGKEIDAYRFAVELNMAERYENAKTALIAVGISGVEHPHYPETYYVLADNVTAENFG